MSLLPPRGRITTRNAAFQQLASLLENRQKRHRAGLFLVQGVRPITVAVERGWPLERLLYRPGSLSRWATDTLAGARADSDVGALEVAEELLGELGETEDGEPPELVAVGRIPDPPGPLEARRDLLAVVFDRPASPGNLGSVIRSADAFGAQAVLVSGHAVDPFDPRVVRASTGSLFALEIHQVDGPADALELFPPGTAVVGTDEQASLALDAAELTGPTVLVIGNEARGLTAAWREACTQLVRIPIGGSASSLNAANAGSIALYEAARQRRAAGGDQIGQAARRSA